MPPPKVEDLIRKGEVPMEFGPSGRRFAALWAVKEHPYHQVVAELFEPVVHPGGDEEDVTRFESMPLGTVAEPARALHDGVDLISTVG
jgi:hypothetical protein